DAEVEQDRGRYDRYVRGAGGPADVVLLEPAYGARGGLEAECAAACEDDRVDSVHQVQRVEQVGFARAGRAAALRDAADGVAVHEDRRAPGGTLGERVVADPDAFDRGEADLRVRGRLGR